MNPTVRSLPAHAIRKDGSYLAQHAPSKVESRGSLPQFDSSNSAVIRASLESLVGKFGLSRH